MSQLWTPFHLSKQRQQYPIQKRPSEAGRARLTTPSPPKRSEERMTMRYASYTCVFEVKCEPKCVRSVIRKLISPTCAVFVRVFLNRENKSPLM
ncbi:hypothetical protein CONLIGDRAFT_190061 [Coniochaeta ligniaria NRRL 30616]|uniref:Uncharacterized protein n=1 Tax=Coniochaeta ligniaria NRRL 30616 TaxID=1408157 RepID=A0A1J7J305_9PEZI|nr:hypothetical protein CONLIGDRAFT_190061 [Coniochaeta ligniaria NRRL 30616]